METCPRRRFVYLIIQPAMLKSSERMFLGVSSMYVCMYVYFSSGGPSAPKVPYWGTGRAELEKSESIYTLFTEILLATKDWSFATRN